MTTTVPPIAPGKPGGDVRRWLIMGLVMVIIAVASSAGTYLLMQHGDFLGQSSATSGASDAANESFTAHGTMTVWAEYFEGSQAECFADSDVGDIRAGATVVVRSDDGTTLAKGALQDGIGVGEGWNGWWETSDTSRMCEFSFDVRDVPAGESFYKVEISYRGEVTFTENELREGIALSL